MNLLFLIKKINFFLILIVFKRKILCSLHRKNMYEFIKTVKMNKYKYRKNKKL